MTQEQLLKSLHPDLAPPPISIWPLAPGWYLLLALLLCALGLGIWLIIRWRRQRYRAQAIRAIEQLVTAQNSPMDTIRATNRILKQVAINQYPSLGVATMSGTTWTAFLQKTSSKPLPEEGLQALADYYNPTHSLDSNSATSAGKTWLRSHHV